MGTKGITSEQLATIRARRIDDAARVMMRSGVSLTWEEADEIGEEGCAWVESRLGLSRTTDEEGIHYETRRYVPSSEELRDCLALSLHGRTLNNEED